MSNAPEVLEPFPFSIKDIIAMQHHIKTINGEMGEMRDTIKTLRKDFNDAVKESSNWMNNVSITVSENAKDLEWLKKFFWLVAGSSVAGLATGLINLFYK